MSAKAILADMEEVVKMASISLFATVYLGKLICLPVDDYD